MKRAPTPPQALWQAFQAELANIFTDRAVLLVIVGGLLFYAVLYPLPYQKSVPGEQAIAVIDHDRTHLARKLIRMADATPQIRVAARPDSMLEAEALLANNAVHGLLVIPSNFERDVYRGRPTSLSFAGDASYFLIYGNVVEGLLTAATTLSVETQIVASLMKGESAAQIPGQVMPVRLISKPAFNPTSGYVNYIVPAVFVLILHQTLLIAAGSVTIKDRARRFLGRPAAPLHLALPLRVMTFVLIYLLFAMLYFGFFFQLYGIPHQASPWALLLFSLLFFTTTCLFALWLGALLPRPELVTVIVLVTSLPIVFTAGFAWPAENLPAWLDYLTLLIPAKPGIQGFLALNQLGAPLASLGREVAILVGLCLLYGGGLIYLMRTQARRRARNAAYDHPAPSSAWGAAVDE
ncbi:ABC transporter permease [Halomonas sp. TBZ9]|uniref:ABC transporter permease n=1 Tax=Vreelandella azerica TaxID=2732867 RepID=A0A7Y3XB11_9GAMM|nr:ABC transporter permease [Halomonas azerica]NOG31904.1 ABC transporter permease [Halomonas azerica]